MTPRITIPMATISLLRKGHGGKITQKDAVALLVARGMWPVYPGSNVTVLVPKSSLGKAKALLETEVKKRAASGEISKKIAPPKRGQVREVD